jgi:hypothetical protein
MDGLEPWHTIEQILFHAKGNQLFNFLGGEAERFGLNLDIRRSKLGQNIDRHGSQLEDSHGQQCGSKNNHWEPELQTQLNDRTQHTEELLPETLRALSNVYRNLALQKTYYIW